MLQNFTQVLGTCLNSKKIHLRQNKHFIYILKKIIPQILPKSFPLSKPKNIDQTVKVPLNLKRHGIDHCLKWT